jgi:hypothetical protein
VWLDKIQPVYAGIFQTHAQSLQRYTQHQWVSTKKQNDKVNPLAVDQSSHHFCHICAWPRDKIEFDSDFSGRKRNLCEFLGANITSFAAFFIKI